MDDVEIMDVVTVDEVEVDDDVELIVAVELVPLELLAVVLVVVTEAKGILSD